MKKAKKTNKSEFSNKKISTAKRPCSGSAAVHDVESAGSKSGNTAVTNPEELLDFAVAGGRPAAKLRRGNIPC